MIRITAKKDGFRRAGVAHMGTRDYPDGRFTPDQVAMLRAEPLLVVEELATPKPAKTEGETEPRPDKPAKPEKPESA